MFDNQIIIRMSEIRTFGFWTFAVVHYLEGKQTHELMGYCEKKVNRKTDIQVNDLYVFTWIYSVAKFNKKILKILFDLF